MIAIYEIELELGFFGQALQKKTNQQGYEYRFQKQKLNLSMDFAQTLLG